MKEAWLLSILARAIRKGDKATEYHHAYLVKMHSKFNDAKGAG